jgi:hypothetical protein
MAGILGFIFVVVCIGAFVAMQSGGPNTGASSTGTPSLGGSGSSTLDFYGLLQSGVQARGILLKVSSQRSARGTASQGFYEVRNVSLDIELPGQKPYQVDCPVSIPVNLCADILPGATLELRVDPQNPRNVAVFGPGVGLPSQGFS